MKLPAWRRRHLDERVDKARKEAELSRQRLAEARKVVVVPLETAKSNNHFADLIRQSLQKGTGT